MRSDPARWIVAGAVGLVALVAITVVVGSTVDGLPRWGGMGMMTPRVTGTVIAGQSAAELYRANCAVCHGADRGGGAGPALLPPSLPRDDAYYIDAIANGRPGTAMPAWSKQGMTADQVAALVAYLRAPR